LLQRAVQKFAATRKKVYTIAETPEKRLVGMWKFVVNHFENTLISEVSCTLQEKFVVGCQLTPSGGHALCACKTQKAATCNVQHGNEFKRH
jgi:hypothetical protein